MDAARSGVWEPPRGRNEGVQEAEPGRQGPGGWRWEVVLPPWREPAESPDELVSSDPDVAMGRWCLRGDWTLREERIRFGFSSGGPKLRQVVFSFCL